MTYGICERYVATPEKMVTMYVAVIIRSCGMFDVVCIEVGLKSNVIEKILENMYK